MPAGGLDRSMKLLRAPILDDRGRRVRLLQLCILRKWLQRGENRLKYEIETPIRWSAKMWLAGFALLPVVMLPVMAATVISLRINPPNSSSFLFATLQGVLVPLIAMAVFLPLHFAIAARWSRLEMRNAYLSRSRCPSCFYDLAAQEADPEDGCCVCPECGAAWRIETAAPPRLFPMPALKDDHGRWMRIGIPLRRRLALAWHGASKRARFDLVAATVLLIVLAPLFGRFVGPYVSDGLQALIRARWGRTIDNAVSLFFAVVAAAGVLSVACLLWRGFWRSHLPMAQKRQGRCAACDAPLPPAVAGGDGLVECGCGATWRLALENGDGSDRTS